MEDNNDIFNAMLNNSIQNRNRNLNIFNSIVNSASNNGATNGFYDCNSNHDNNQNFCIVNDSFEKENLQSVDFSIKSDKEN